jgi:hypothetical protein
MPAWLSSFPYPSSPTASYSSFPTASYRRMACPPQTTLRLHTLPPYTHTPPNPSLTPQALSRGDPCPVDASGLHTSSSVGSVVGVALKLTRLQEQRGGEDVGSCGGLIKWGVGDVCGMGCFMPAAVSVVKLLQSSSHLQEGVCVGGRQCVVLVDSMAEKKCHMTRCVCVCRGGGAEA